jgi:signal transduction histidine kinase
VGLGLALARRIARAHGGDVTLSSQPGQGTIARLEVPLAPLA